MIEESVRDRQLSLWTISISRRWREPEKGLSIEISSQSPL
jgi:hypothetical protein